VEIGFYTGLTMYLVIWWLVLFMVLPFGARETIDAEDVAKGHASSAPKRPRLLLKMAITAVITGFVYAGIYYALTTGLISLSG